MSTSLSPEGCSASQARESFSASVICRYVESCSLSIVFSETERHEKLKIKFVGKCVGHPA